MAETILEQLKIIAGEDCVTTQAQQLDQYGQDWTRFYQPNPMAVVFARDIDQLAELVRFANLHHIGLVPSGGRTGLSGGACATNGEVIVSFDNLNQIKNFSAADRSVTVQAGVVTAKLQQFARDNDLYYPVDFASSGSSQIGGNIATNAGGIRVIRYGLTRDRVTGLKVITGAGEVLSLNRGLIKNATGYDLRHLFIGSEGTLGFIVEATLQLEQTPVMSNVMLLAVPRMEDCLKILSVYQSQVTLNAFEFFSDNALTHVMTSSGLDQPFKDRANYYVLIEFEQPDQASADAAADAFSRALDHGWTTDAVLATSDRQCQTLWQFRERISEAISPHTPYKNDVSVQVSLAADFLGAINRAVAQAYPDVEIVWFGHIGDGNLHLNILRPANVLVNEFREKCERVNSQVLAIVAEFKGSISAEHGVGLLKKQYLHLSRSVGEVAAMKAIKSVFDPAGIMNPGKIF